MNQKIFEKLNRGLELHKQNKLDEAEALYEEVRAANPKNPDALHLLGVVALARRDLEKAKALIIKAIKIKGNDSAYFSNLGIVLKDQGEYSSALTSFDHALRLQPGYPEALSNRGLTLEGLGRHEDALAEFDRAIAARPGYAAAYSNRGITLQTMQRSEEALASFRQAIAADPEFADAWNNYAALLRRLRRYDESLKIYDRTLKLNPRNFKGFQGRGELLTELGRTEEAFADFDRALALNPNYPDPLWAKAFTYLSIGEFDKGWDLYDFRFDQSNRQAGVLNTNKPRWTAARRNERVLLWSEQGIGDELFFAQWLYQASELASATTVAVDGRLVTTHERAFPDLKFIDKAKPIPRESYDCHLSLGSLPRALRDAGLDWRSARRMPYLVADDTRSQKLRADLLRPGHKLVGLTWRSTRPELGAEKSLTLKDLLPVLKTPNTTFVNLQYGDTQEEVEAFTKETGVELVNHPDVDNFRDLEAHIDLVAACDDLLLVCNATAHIAGTLGKHAFLLTPLGKSLIWYWANRENGRSLWYPSIELFDQNSQFSWSSAIETIATRLR
jgi:tetratricopeptide (TPR) repeat protein